jgi:group I intron endonuclease
MNRYGSIYLATNSVTGEQYVGQTRQKLNTRIYAHKISSQKPKFKINYAIHKYGFENFIFEEIYVAFDRHALNDAEKTFIAELCPAYNMTRGGAGRPTTTSIEQRQKMSENAKRRWANPEWRAKTVASIRAVSATEKFKEVCRDRLRGRNLAAVRWASHVKKVVDKKDLAQSIKQSWNDPEIRKRRVDGLKLAMQDPEVIAKKRKASIGRVQSDETIQKIAQSKHKRIFCKEMDFVFFSQKDAATYFNVRRSAITESIKRKGKVRKEYTLVRVA